MQSLARSGCCAILLAAGSAAAAPVANPGFETYTSCPTLSSQIALAPPWDTPTDASPDYFHSCGSGSIDVPNNFWGSEFAYAGEAYAAPARRSRRRHAAPAPVATGSPGGAGGRAGSGAW